MKLMFDSEDLAIATTLKDQRFNWLQELGAIAIQDARIDEEGFLFGYQSSDAHLANQIAKLPKVRDRPNERQELINLDDILDTLASHKISVPTPKTWCLQLDDPLPHDLEFPLFLRTRKLSWKRGGQQFKVHNARELNNECDLLRRAFSWNADIIARVWLDLAPAGDWMFGDAPQEIRTWIVDGEPMAWSFHYLNVVTKPEGFPPPACDLTKLKNMAQVIATPFSSRLIVVDFVRDKRGDWHFLEAGPGAVAGTAHKNVFQFVASRMLGRTLDLKGDPVGGAF